MEETKSPILGQNHLVNHSHSERMVKAFSQAIELSRTPSQAGVDLWVLFVIEDKETNVGD